MYCEQLQFKYQLQKTKLGKVLMTQIAGDRQSNFLSTNFIP